MHKPPGKPVKALVLDDDLDFLAYVRELLNSLGITVTTCQSFKEFIAALDTRPDVLFVEMVMAGTDGIQVIEQLALRSVTIPIVMMSAADSQVLEAASRYARLEGMSVAGGLHKPFWPEDVTAILDTLGQPSEAELKQRELPLDEVTRAIDERRLVMHYQPKVDCVTQQVLGVEALARLESPTGALIFPDRFLGAMESTALMKSFAALMLEIVLSDMVAFEKQGLTVNVAINVGINLLEVGNYPDSVRDGCDRYGISASRLTLEITERSISEHVTTVLKVATRIRILGMGLSIDDFGTAFSSVERLRNLPFSELKIDRSLVSGCVSDPQVKARCEGIVGMANQLDLKVVAEGVEIAAELDTMIAIGCHTIQGYYISRPINAAQLPRWVSNWNHSNLMKLGCQ